MRTVNVFFLLLFSASVFALDLDLNDFQELINPDESLAKNNVILLELKEPSLTQYYQSFEQTHQRAPNKVEQKKHLEKILAEQASVLASLSDEYTVVSQLSRAVNGIKVISSGNPAQEEPKNVKTRHQVGIYKQSTAFSSPWIGSNRFHDFGIYGEGVRIGIIDSGIDYSHFALGGDGSTQRNNDPSIIESGTFPNAKVVGGIDLAGDNFNASSADPQFNTPNPDPDPLDQGGHGTHVAATVAGLGSEGFFAPGIAPAADLYAIKIFGNGPGTTTFLQEEAIDWALDPNQDGDLSDHLDIVNLSLGSAFGAVQADSSIAIQRAVDFGIVVVAAAGNDGVDIPYVVAAPSVASGAISVAANHLGNQRYVPMVLQSNTATTKIQAWVANTGHALQGTISGEAYFPAADQNQPCSPGLVSIANKIIFLSTLDQCNALDKTVEAFFADAKAVVFYNNPDFIYSGGYGENTFVNITKPFFAISEDIAINQGMSVTIDLESQTLGRPDNPLATFSSAGPKNGVFKPDLSAPGVNINSAAAGSGTFGVNIAGTSMASPHVAGAAALVKALHPELSVAQVKAMLMNYTTPLSYGNGDYVETSLQGLGELNVGNILEADTIAFPAGLSFGTLDLQEFVRVERTLTVKNMSAESRLYRVEHHKTQSFPGMHFSYPTSVWVPADSELSFVVAIHMNPFEMQNIELPPILEFDGWFSISHDSELPARVGFQSIIRPVSTVNSRRDGDSIVLYNNSQRATPVSGYHVLPDLLNQSAQIGLEFGFNIEQAKEPLIHFALSFAQPWDSVSGEFVQMAMDIDGDNLEDFTIFIFNSVIFGSATPYLSVLVFDDVGNVFFETQVEAGYNSRVMRFSMPWSRQWSDGLFFVSATTPEGFGQKLLPFSGILGLPELPQLHDLKPYRNTSVSYSGETLWYVPGADVKNQSVLIPSK